MLFAVSQGHVYDTHNEMNVHAQSLCRILNTLFT